jgi:hypothetical protein
LAAATFTSRLGEWFQVYTFEPPQLPSNVLINNRPVVANWKYVPSSTLNSCSGIWNFDLLTRSCSTGCCWNHWLARIDSIYHTQSGPSDPMDQSSNRMECARIVSEIWL